MMNSDTFFLPLTSSQPSQLLISAEELSAIQPSIKMETPDDLPPIPIKAIDGIMAMTDRHTRAYAACLAGMTTVPLIWDEDDLDWDAYRICVAWCLDEEIQQISDLASRVIDSQAFETFWLGHCQ